MTSDGTISELKKTIQRKIAEIEGELANGIDSLKYKLVALGEERWSIVGRRLEDRIHALAAKAEEFPINSPESQEITELMKAELSEYFECEKNPAYDADRRNILR